MKKLNATMTLEQQQMLQKKLVLLVEEKKTARQIAGALGINYTTVHRWLRALGLNLPNFHNALKFDNTVFDAIDTEEKAYWLGFLYADGYVASNKNIVELSLKGADADHLEKFRKFLNYTKEVTLSNSKCGDKVFFRCRLSMCDKHFHDTLVSKGCTPNKSLTLAFPKKSLFASEDLIIHFIRGYVDGDGSVDKASSGYSRFEILGTYEFLEGIKEHFKGFFTAAYHKDKRHPNSNTFSLSLSGKKAAEFGDILYKDATIYLQRKYIKFIENKYDERKHLQKMHAIHNKRKLSSARVTNGLRENQVSH